MTFRPLPGLTLVTAIALAILLSLGTWQYKRLHWKTDLIATIEAAANAPALTYVSDIERAFEAGEPVDFRRVRISAEPVQSDVAFLVYAPRDRQTFWQAYRLVQDNSGALPVYVTAEYVPDAEKSSYAPAPLPSGDYAGYVRVRQTPRGMAKKSTASENRYFGFDPVPDQQSWGAPLPGFAAEDRFYIQLAHAPDASAPDSLPVKVPEIRNNHLDYMLTWYGLAVTLLIIYLILHHRQGRLSFRRKD